MLLEKDMKLADIILHDNSLVPVISRFGIFLGFGDDSIQRICDKRGIDSDFLLTILNTFHDPQYLDKEYLQSFSVELLIEYLMKTHQYYLNIKIPEISGLIDNMELESKIEKDSYKLLKRFFEDYKTELFKHIEREESVVYPYVLELNKSIVSDSVSDQIISKIKEYSITSYEDEHDNVEEKLTDLKNIIIKYLAPCENQQSRYSLLKELTVLEKDLGDHSQIEDVILVPKVELLEKNILKRLESE